LHAAIVRRRQIALLPARSAVVDICLEINTGPAAIGERSALGFTFSISAHLAHLTGVITLSAMLGVALEVNTYVRLDKGVPRVYSGASG
jgi:hypothetical protein